MNEYCIGTGGKRQLNESTIDTMYCIWGDNPFKF